MSDNSVKNYDALTVNRINRIHVGRRDFTISHIPAIVSMMFTRHTYGLLVDGEGKSLDVVDLKLQALIHTLNADLPQQDRIDEAWVMENIPAEQYDQIVDDLLGPFYEARERAQQRQQEKIVDLLTPAIQAAVKEEIAAQQKQPQKTLKNR